MTTAKVTTRTTVTFVRHYRRLFDNVYFDEISNSVYICPLRVHLFVESKELYNKYLLEVWCTEFPWTIRFS